MLMLLLCGSLGVIGKNLHNDKVKVYYYLAKSGAVTASGMVINERRVKSGEQRVIAISRDLKKKFKFGDSVCVKGYGHFIVGDLMHKRHRNTIDILVVRGKEIKNSKSAIIKKM